MGRGLGPVSYIAGSHDSGCIFNHVAPLQIICAHSQTMAPKNGDFLKHEAGCSQVDITSSDKGGYVTFRDVPGSRTIPERLLELLFYGRL